MRELCLTELNLVSGGLNANDLKNYKPPASVRAAGALISLAARRSPAAIAFKAGYKGGQWLNNNTPIQGMISNGIDSMTSKDGSGYGSSSDGCDY